MGRPPKAATTGKACATKYGGSRNRAISGKDSTASIPPPLTGEGEGGGERETQGTERRPEPAPPHPNLPPPGGKENKRDIHFEKSPRSAEMEVQCLAGLCTTVRKEQGSMPSA